jgi:predicted branched-subunit amino acid permease
VGAAGLINARFLPMGAAVAGSLRGSRWRRALEGQAVIDTSWVGAYCGEGRFDREKLLGSTAVQWPAWIGGTLVGALLAPSPELVERLGLDVVFPGFYLLLLLETLGGAAATRWIAAVAALLAAALLLVAPAGLALLGAGAAALLALRRPA